MFIFPMHFSKNTFYNINFGESSDNLYEIGEVDIYVVEVIVRCGVVRHVGEDHDVLEERED